MQQRQGNSAELISVVTSLYISVFNRSCMFAAFLTCVQDLSSNTLKLDPPLDLQMKQDIGGSSGAVWMFSLSTGVVWMVSFSEGAVWIFLLPLPFS